MNNCHIASAIMMQHDLTVFATKAPTCFVPLKESSMMCEVLSNPLGNAVLRSSSSFVAMYIVTLYLLNVNVLPVLIVSLN